MVTVDTLSQFAFWIDPSELKLPASTMVFEEEEGKVIACLVGVQTIDSVNGLRILFRNA